MRKISKNKLYMLTMALLSAIIAVEYEKRRGKCYAATIFCRKFYVI